jgi:flagellar basal body-associated protein FliL
MKTDKLESFINDNRHDFDALEPSDKVWEAISRELDKQAPQQPKKYLWMKIAAVLVMGLLASGIIIYQSYQKGHQTAVALHVDPEVQELMEAEAYYSQEVESKMAEIEKCYQVNPELKIEIENDLNELEVMYRSLKNDLKDNVSNKEVIEAMIENNRNRVKLVDEVLEQIKC